LWGSRQAGATSGRLDRAEDASGHKGLEHLEDESLGNSSGRGDDVRGDRSIFFGMGHVSDGTQCVSCCAGKSQGELLICFVSAKPRAAEGRYLSLEYNWAAALSNSPRLLAPSPGKPAC